MPPRSKKVEKETIKEVEKPEEKKPEIETYSGKEFIGQEFTGVTFKDEEIAFADFGGCVFTDCKFKAKKIRNCNFKDAKFFSTADNTVIDPETNEKTTTKTLVADNPLTAAKVVHCCVIGCNVDIDVERIYQ